MRNTCCNQSVRALSGCRGQAGRQGDRQAGRKAANSTHVCQQSMPCTAVGRIRAHQAGGERYSPEMTACVITHKGLGRGHGERAASCTGRRVCAAKSCTPQDRRAPTAHHLGDGGVGRALPVDAHPVPNPVWASNSLELKRVGPSCERHRDVELVPVGPQVHCRRRVRGRAGQSGRKTQAGSQIVARARAWGVSAHGGTPTGPHAHAHHHPPVSSFTPSTKMRVPSDVVRKLSTIWKIQSPSTGTLM